MKNEKNKRILKLVCWIVLGVLYSVMAPIAAFVVSFNSSNSAAPNFLNKYISLPWYVPYIVLIAVGIPAIVLFVKAVKCTAAGRKVPLKIKIPLFIITLPFVIFGLLCYFGEFITAPLYQLSNLGK